MKILWISSLAWKREGTYPYTPNGAGAVAGSLFEQSMIEGLEIAGHEVDIISDYPYAAGANPHARIEWSHREGARDVSVKTVDVPYLSLFYKEHTLRAAVRDRLRENTYDVAVAYLIHQPYMSALAYAKRLCPTLRTVLICPDLPDMMDMSLSEKPLKALLKRLDMRRVSRLYHKMDGFVLFAEAMRERIDLHDAPYTVIEGVATVDGLDITPVEREKFLLYAGTLHKNIGIETIIDSLAYIRDPEVTLHLFGTGELEGYIREAAARDGRILYGGFIDRAALFEEEKRALALVNARNPEDAYTRYSFPSKTFEYLYSATPFVTTRLGGVPREYSEYLWEADAPTPESIADVINQILDTDSSIVEERGIRARTFVSEEKNKEKQSAALLRFMEQLLSRGGATE